MVFVKKSTFFSYLFFMSKKSQKETFFNIQGPVVGTRVCANLGLNFNPGFFFSLSKALSWIIFSILFRVSNHPCFFFFGKKARKRHFLIFWIEKNACFLDLKSEVLKKSKKATFSKGVSRWFLSKNRPFVIYFFCAKKARKKHFLILWIEKNAF